MNAFREQTPVTQTWLPATTLKEALNAVVIVALREMVPKGTVAVRHCYFSWLKWVYAFLHILQISMSVKENQTCVMIMPIAPTHQAVTTAAVMMASQEMASTAQV